MTTLYSPRQRHRLARLTFFFADQSWNGGLIVLFFSALIYFLLVLGATLTWSDLPVARLCRPGQGLCLALCLGFGLQACVLRQGWLPVREQDIQPGGELDPSRFSEAVQKKLGRAFQDQGWLTWREARMLLEHPEEVAMPSHWQWTATSVSQRDRLASARAWHARAPALLSLTRLATLEEVSVPLTTRARARS